MLKGEINWQEIIKDINLSDAKISAALIKMDADYSVSGVVALRTGRSVEPAYSVGVKLLMLRKARNEEKFNDHLTYRERLGIA